MKIGFYHECGIRDLILTLPVVSAVVSQLDPSESAFVSPFPRVHECLQLWLSNAKLRSRIVLNGEGKPAPLALRFSCEPYSVTKTASRTVYNFCVHGDDGDGVIASHRNHLKTWLGISCRPFRPWRASRRSLRKRILLVAGGAPRDVCLPLSTLLDLAEGLKRHLGFGVRFVADVNEEDPEGPLRGALTAKAPVTEIYEEIRDADMVIGSDSEFGYLARACAVPTCTVYGPSRPQQEAGSRSRDVSIVHACAYFGGAFGCLPGRAGRCEERPCLSTVSALELEIAARKSLFKRLYRNKHARFVVANDVEAFGSDDRGYLVSQRVGLPLSFSRGFSIARLELGSDDRSMEVAAALFEHGLLDVSWEYRA